MKFQASEGLKSKAKADDSNYNACNAEVRFGGLAEKNLVTKMEVKIALIKDRFSSMEMRQILTELAILQNQHRFCHVTVNTSYKIS